MRRCIVIMDINITGQVVGDLGLDKTIAELKKLDGKTIEAGLFDEMNEKKAIWNEYGTSRGIPARPFLRTALYENEARYANFIAPFVAQVLEGGPAENIGERLGKFMVMSIQRTIASGGFVPNAPGTVTKKGHSKTLIDTGEMYGAIDWRES